MSLIGTIIFYPEESARDPEPIAPTLTSISQLLYGQSAASGTDVVQHMLKCNDYTNYDGVTLNAAYTHTPFTAKVETMMRSIAEKITTRTRAIPNNSTEVGFVDFRLPSRSLQDALHRHQHPGVGFVRQSDRPVPRRDRRRL